MTLVNSVYFTKLYFFPLSKGEAISKDWIEKKSCNPGFIKEYLTRAEADAGILSKFAEECKKGCDDDANSSLPGKKCAVARIDWSGTTKICAFLDEQCENTATQLAAAGHYLYIKSSKDQNLI